MTNSFIVCALYSARPIVARSDLGKTPESRPPPEQEFIDENQAGPDPGESRTALAGPNPEPTHDDFMANVYPNVHESLKFPIDEHVIIEEPLSLTETLYSMKNLDDAPTIGDQFLNEKSTEDDPKKLNVEAEMVSMVTVPIYQASSSAPPLSTPVIDLSLPKPVSSTTQAPIFTATKATTTTLPLLPLLQQQSTTDSELAARSGTYKSIPKHVALYEAHEASMERANRDEFFVEKEKSHKRRHDDQDPHPLPPDLDPNQAEAKMVEAYSRERQTSNSRTRLGHSELPEPEYNWANALAKSYKDPEENKLLSQTGDMGSFIKWFCKRIGKKKLSKADLEGPCFKVVKAFHENNISLQFKIEECHRLLTDQVDLVNPEGDTARTAALSISKLKAANYPDFGLEELVSSLWIGSQRDYNISSAYGITHWWFKRKDFYITRHNASFDQRAVRSHMQILSVISIKIFERYGYAFLKEIVIRKADYSEYKISEADFKNLHPNDFEDLCLLHFQGKLNHLPRSDKVYLYNVITLWIRNIVIKQRMGDLQLSIESYQIKLNLTEPRWDASDFLFKEDYTIISKPMAVIYIDRND
uniref:Uncharacterized protein n=1 Tax=Tanacetum cinerariifolium TaxID=118510 RepID=A0A699H4R3_TANCI|nr:hypothetical protein [Tanacetum cinerariifolium]